MYFRTPINAKPKVESGAGRGAGPVLGQAAAVTEVPRSNPWIGGPTKFFFERVVEAELPEAEYLAVVDEIRRVLNNVGQVSQLGRSFSWTSARSGASRRDLEVAVSVRGGRTRITIHETLGTLIGAVFGGIGGGMGGGGMGPLIAFVTALHAGPSLGVILPLWFATTYVTARTVFQRNSRRRAQELVQLADRLAALISELAPERPALGNRGP